MEPSATTSPVILGFLVLPFNSGGNVFCPFDVLIGKRRALSWTPSQNIIVENQSGDRSDPALIAAIEEYLAKSQPKPSRIQMERACR